MFILYGITDSRRRRNPGNKRNRVMRSSVLFKSSSSSRPPMPRRRQGVEHGWTQRIGIHRCGRCADRTVFRIRFSDTIVFHLSGGTGSDQRAALDGLHVVSPGYSHTADVPATHLRPPRKASCDGDDPAGVHIRLHNVRLCVEPRDAHGGGGHHRAGGGSSRASPAAWGQARSQRMSSICLRTCQSGWAQ